jgi:hypothetical protein
MLISACILGVISSLTLVGCNDGGSDDDFKGYVNEVTFEEYSLAYDELIAKSFLNPAYEFDYEYTCTGHTYEEQYFAAKEGEGRSELRDTDLLSVGKYDKDNKINITTSTDSDGTRVVYIYDEDDVVYYVRNENIKTIMTDSIEALLGYENENIMGTVYGNKQKSKFYVDGNVLTIVLDYTDEIIFNRERVQYYTNKETVQIVFKDDEIIVNKTLEHYSEYVLDYFGTIKGSHYDQKSNTTYVYTPTNQELVVPEEILAVAPR